MTDLEDLVREALATTPNPASITDPVTALNQRVRRARRHLSVGTAVLGVVVAVAVAVPLTVTQHGRSARIGVTKPPTTSISSPAVSYTEKVWNQATEGVASGDDGSGEPAVWAKLYTSRDKVHGTTNLLAKLDPSTGRVLQRVDVPVPASFISIGLGQVWVYGGGDGGYPDGAISRINPTTKAVTTLRFNGGPSRLVFVGGSAYTTVGPDDDLARIGGATGPLHLSDPIPNSAGVDFPAPDGTLWVEQAHGWRHLKLSGNHVETLGTATGWHGFLLNPGPTEGTFWLSDTKPSTTCRMRSVTLSFRSAAVSASYGPWISTVGAPEDVVGTPDGGLYVQTGPRCRPRFLQTISYYSPEALRSSDPQPVVLDGGVSGYGMVEDPDDGVLFIGQGAELDYWNPLQYG